MTNNQLKRLKKLQKQPRKTLEDLLCENKLLKDFYRHYGQAIHEFEERKT